MTMMGGDPGISTFNKLLIDFDGTNELLGWKLLPQRTWHRALYPECAYMSLAICLWTGNELDHNVMVVLYCVLFP